MKLKLSLLSGLFCCIIFIGCTDKKMIDDTNDVLTFRVNNTHSGVYQGKEIFGEDGFNWVFQTDGPVRSSVVIYNNIVFTGSSDGNLYAVELKTGKEKWRFNAGGAVQSTPAIYKNRIFFSSRNGKLYSLDINTGKEEWSFDLGKDLPLKWGFDYYLSSPVIENGNIFVGSGSGMFYSINSGNGTASWQYDCRSRVRSTAAVSGELVLFGDMDGKFYALNKSTGKLKWKFEVEGVKYDNSKFGFDRRSIMSSASVYGDNVVFGSRDGNLYNVNLNTGKEIWRVSHGTSWVITSPAIYNGVVYDGSSDGRFVQAVDLKTGNELWHTKTYQAVWSSLAVSNNELFFGDLGGAMYSLDIKTGKTNWVKKLLNGFITSSPVIAGNNILVGADDGCLYSIKGKLDNEKKSDFKRAVFYQPVKGFNWFHNSVDEGIKNYFQKFGYDVLDSKTLASFFKEQIRSKTKSVVVFATNKIPFSVYNEEENNFLIKDYLSNGGKIVLLGANPLAYVYDKKSDKLAGIDFRIPSKVFGVNYNGEFTDAMKGWFYSRVTPEGERWGLKGWWVGIASVDKKDVTTVLALDENGNAAAWVKNYGGPKGSGLVQLWIDRNNLPDLSGIKSAAEYGL